ncbi:MAG: ABC transporter ATP-binding protein [Arenicella sp.]|jgi:ABC-2 type transport system ATP-binding protein|nr:ABC transporter ATP-binding protein [Arenicella sp.]
MTNIVEIRGLSKVYDNGFQALDNVDLDIVEGEILALLGPNGAGKTTLISAIAGIVSPSAGTITIGGFDNQSEYRKARQLVGLVPQELTLGSFDTVWNTVSFTRGLYGHKPDPAHIEKVLRDLSLWDKKDNQLRMLSGGMKRRVLIAKALSHNPRVLFLDEPTAGVDVELRKDMWRLVSALRKTGVTIILTTHYIEEAEEIADRVGVINSGKILLIENKTDLMSKMGKKQLVIDLREPIASIPESLSKYAIEMSEGGETVTYTYDTTADATGITALLQDFSAAGMQLKDIRTTQSSLEDIFVDLVHQD